MKISNPINQVLVFLPNYFERNRPLADERGLEKYPTVSAISSTIANLRISEVGRMFLKKSLSTSFDV